MLSPTSNLTQIALLCRWSTAGLLAALTEETATTAATTPNHQMVSMCRSGCVKHGDGGSQRSRIPRACSVSSCLAEAERGTCLFSQRAVDASKSTGFPLDVFANTGICCGYISYICKYNTCIKIYSSLQLICSV